MNPARAGLLIGLLTVACWSPTQAREIDLIVIHATGGPGCKQGQLWHAPGGNLESIRRYFQDHPGISYHYLIGRDGTTLSGVPEAEVAHHARGHNARSIGIELVNDGNGKDSFPDMQIDALITLLQRLVRIHGLTPEQIKSHSAVDDRSFLCGGRRYKQKVDPGGEYPGSKGNFPWQRIRDALK
ncbi:N-acetylmuramoyl-L-alanine amidase [Thiocystis violacea]|uniref:N-acetylmuramoyl-L-alanine amidase n=1 Tax=Thiocystis violacea TaxID=13725 RepID=UPI001F5B46FF|nr:peptidoglycan recognition family protein [Thiocystis violacea]